MRIGCDLDGVLADLNRAFSAVARRRYPQLDVSAVTAADEVAAAPGVTDDSTEGATEALAMPEDDHVPLALTRGQMDETWKELCGVTDFWETLEEIEDGAIARLATLADAQPVRRSCSSPAVRVPRADSSSAKLNGGSIERASRYRACMSCSESARADRRRAGPGRRDRRSAGELPGCGARVQGAGDSDLAGRCRERARVGQAVGHRRGANGGGVSVDLLVEADRSAATPVVRATAQARAWSWPPRCGAVTVAAQSASRAFAITKRAVSYTFVDRRNRLDARDDRTLLCERVEARVAGAARPGDKSESRRKQR